MTDPLTYLMEAGMPLDKIKWCMERDMPPDVLASAVKDMLDRGMTMDEILADDSKTEGFGGFEGFAGGSECENENEFPEFLEFSGPDLSKNPCFPAGELSKALCNFTVHASTSLQVAVDMTSVSTLEVASLCSQRKFKVHPYSDWFEPVNLYSAIVAQPSERKSSTVALVSKPVYQYQREENERRRSQVEEYRDKKDVLQRRIESLKKSASSGRKAKNGTSDPVEDIQLLRHELEDLEKDAIDYISLTADDITMEALASKMAVNGEKMAKARCCGHCKPSETAENR